MEPETWRRDSETETQKGDLELKAQTGDPALEIQEGDFEMGNQEENSNSSQTVIEHIEMVENTTAGDPTKAEKHGMLVPSLEVLGTSPEVKPTLDQTPDLRHRINPLGGGFETDRVAEEETVIERSALATPTQNSAAERSWGMILKARAVQVVFFFPRPYGQRL